MAFAMSNIGCTKLFIASQDHSALIAGHRAVAPHPAGAIPFQWILLCPLESPGHQEPLDRDYECMSAGLCTGSISSALARRDLGIPGSASAQAHSAAP